MAEQLSLSDLVKNTWGQDNILNRKQIGLELYKNGLQFLNSKPMALNDFDVLFNQIDRKSNFVLKNLLKLLQSTDVNLQEQYDDLLIKAINKKTEEFGYGVEAPVLKLNSDLCRDITGYNNRLYTLQGKYKNTPNDSKVWSAFLIVHAAFGMSGYRLLTIISPDASKNVPEVWCGCRINGGSTDIYWYKVSYTNYTNEFNNLQIFNNGIFDAKTQIGLTSNSKLLNVYTDKDLTQLPLGAKFLCNIKNYNNTPLKSQECAYIERVGTRDIDANNGVFRLITPFFESGNIKVFYGALSNDVNNNQISWREVSFLDNEHNFAYLDRPNVFSKINTFTDVIGLNLNGAHNQKINNYNILQSTALSFNLLYENLSSNIYIERSGYSKHLTLNVTNSDIVFNQNGDLINENSGFFKILDKRIQDNIEPPLPNGLLEKLLKLNVYFYQSKLSGQRDITVDVNTLETMDRSLVKTHKRFKKLSDGSVLTDLKMFDYGQLACINTAAITELVKTSGIGIGQGYWASWPPDSKSPTYFEPTTYQSIFDLKAGFSKTVSWKNYVGEKPPYYKDGDYGQLTCLGTASGCGSLLYTTIAGQWGLCYLGFINSNVKVTDPPGKQQIMWLKIPLTGIVNSWTQPNYFYAPTFTMGTGIGGVDENNTSQAWIDIGKHKKYGGYSSISLWATPNDQTFTLSTSPQSYGDTHYYTKRDNVFHNKIIFKKDGGTGQNGGSQAFVAQDYGNNVTAGVTNNGGCFVSQLQETMGKFIFYFSDISANYSEGRVALCPFDANQWKTWSFRNDANAYAWGGSWINGSDKRIKENIKPIDKVLDKIQQINTYSYNRIDQTKNEIGVIAQEVEKVFPEVVELNTNEHKFKDGTSIKNVLGVNYGGLTAVAIQAIKELTQQVEELKKQVEELKNGK